MKIYQLIISAIIGTGLLGITARADDQKDKLDKAKKLEERIRQPEAPVVSTTTKKVETMHRSDFVPPQKLKITAPPSPPTSTAPSKSTTTTTTTSRTTATAPSTSTVSKSTSTAPSSSAPKKPADKTNK